jgi:hypothetical protein
MGDSRVRVVVGAHEAGLEIDITDDVILAMRRLMVELSASELRQLARCAEQAADRLDELGRER